MFEDPLFWLLVGPGLALGLYAQARIKANVTKYSQVPTRDGITGAEVARRLLDAKGLQDVKVETTEGVLSDHYDPRNKTLRLSEPVYNSRSMSAFGVAAHEVGHAIQHANGYLPLKLRSGWVPIANAAGGFSTIVILVAFLLGGAATVAGTWAAVAGILLMAATTVLPEPTSPCTSLCMGKALPRS